MFSSPGPRSSSPVDMDSEPSSQEDVNEALASQSTSHTSNPGHSQDQGSPQNRASAYGKTLSSTEITVRSFCFIICNFHFTLLETGMIEILLRGFKVAASSWPEIRLCAK